MITEPYKKDRYALLRVLFTPHGAHCYNCGVPLAPYEDIGESSFLCSECMKKIEPLTYRICKRCGAPMPRHHEADYCGDCNFEKVNIDFMRGAVLWNDISKKLVYALKTDAAREVVNTMVWFMKRELRAMNEETEMVTPVPTYRPYNKSGHATFIAVELARQMKLPLSRGSLIKVRSSEKYSAAGFSGRQEQAARNFKVIDKRDFRGKRVLIVDDVITTGNTMNACAGLLKEAGAEFVMGISFARVAYRLKEIKREEEMSAGAEKKEPGNRD